MVCGDEIIAPYQQQQDYWMIHNIIQKIFFAFVINVIVVVCWLVSYDYFT